jgi:hypothetical protein
LLRLAKPDLLPVSAVVPNCNYAGYLEQRLASIFAQSHPAEIILLDDASTDDFHDVAIRTAAEWKREIIIHAEPANSGSVCSAAHPRSTDRGPITPAAAKVQDPQRPRHASIPSCVAHRQASRQGTIQRSSLRDLAQTTGHTRLFTSRNDDAHNSSVTSIDAPAIP